MNEVTRIINAIQQGNGHASEELLPLVYEELRLLAAQKMSQEKPGQTLQATALVHEAYLRLIGVENQDWNSRGHFFMAAAEAMRRILVENARRKKSLKRGGDNKKVHLMESDKVITETPFDLLVLNEALTNLLNQEPTIGELVKLRFFAGLILDQAAKTLNISVRSAARYWAYGRALLLEEISQE